MTSGLQDCGDHFYLTGYWCARDQSGEGFATEATNAAVRYAFGALKAKTVMIDFCEGNVKSARVVQKLGFTPAGIRSKTHTRHSDGTLLDEHVFIRTDICDLPDLDVSWN